MKQDNVVLVIGASRGLGKCLAQILYHQGYTVIGTYYQTKIEAKYEMYKCNITKENDVEDLFKDVIKKYQHLDAVVNCATYCDDCDYDDKTLDSFMEVVKVNLGGTFLVDKYACLNMQKGTIINISSTDATDTYTVYSMDYAASKAGIENLTMNFAQRMPNLKILALAPSWIDTQTVLDMDPKYLESEMLKHGQIELLHKENVANKIIDMITSNKYQSGSIIRMEHNDE